jgi:hypothetical protein
MAAVAARLPFDFAQGKKPCPDKSSTFFPHALNACRSTKDLFLGDIRSRLLGWLLENPALKRIVQHEAVPER